MSLVLFKLEYYGVNAKTKNWIQSFLQNRQQRVILEGAASEQAPVLSDGSKTVPWGTPDRTGACSDAAPSSMTLCCLFCRND
jgi:hypothetical protein